MPVAAKVADRTFVVLQVLTNVYFARSGFWRILLNGGVADAPTGTP